MADENDLQLAHSLQTAASSKVQQKRRGDNEELSPIKKPKNVSEAASEKDKTDTKIANATDSSEAEGSSCTATSSCTVDEPLKITDLPIDVLENIFAYVNLGDLIKVADLNANAAKAASLVFERRFANHLIRMVFTSDTPRVNEVGNSTVTIENPTVSSRLLSTFGDSIKYLQLVHKSDEDVAHGWTDVRNLIVKHCTKSLIRFCLNNCAEKFFDNIEKPFEKVTYLIITNRLENGIDLGKLFPNLYHLGLNAINASLSTPGYETTIKSVPQLSALILGGTMNSSLLRIVNEHCVHLKELFFNFLFFEDRDQPKETIVFENIETLDIAVECNVGVLPFEFRKLTKLCLYTFELYEELMDFILKHRDLMYFELYARGSAVDKYQLAKHFNTVNQLAELAFFDFLELDEVAFFLAECETIKKLRIAQWNPTDYGANCDLARSNWITECNGRELSFTRKD